MKKNFLVPNDLKSRIIKASSKVRVGVTLDEETPLASATALLLVLSRTAGPGTQPHRPAKPATGATRSFCHQLAFSNSLELFSYKCEVTYKLQFLINSFAIRVLYRDIKKSNFFHYLKKCTMNNSN